LKPSVPRNYFQPLDFRVNRAGNIAPAFCQIAWVVRDMATAERFFVETMGISRFLHMDNLAAKETDDTYLGKPADWVCNLHIAYAGDTQIELIQPVSGASIYQESLDYADYPLSRAMAPRRVGPTFSVPTARCCSPGPSTGTRAAWLSGSPRRQL
jgi:hypothetical protein